MAEIPWLNRRFYQVEPDRKSLEQCRSHGIDHASYGWRKQMDPRWSDEQISAYLKGYEEIKLAGDSDD